jgi:hypothetical protein
VKLRGTGVMEWKFIIQQRLEIHSSLSAEGSDSASESTLDR